MQLVSVNVGTERPILNAKPSGRTGIFKVPHSGAVRVTVLGLEDDAIVDTEHHGGLDQAIYVFTTPDYGWWSARVGRPLGPGSFGENFTISDLESAALRIGDRLRVGAVLLEVTSPRIPCVTLAVRMEDPQFIKKFRHAERPGAYCRVIEAGTVQADDPVELIPYAGTAVCILEPFRVFYHKSPTEEQLRRFLEVPMHRKDRAGYAARLAALQAGAAPD